MADAMDVDKKPEEERLTSEDLDERKKTGEDFTERLNECEAAARSILDSQGDLQAAIDKVIALEKLTRQAADHVATRRLALFAMGLCREKEQWTILQETLVLLMKRRGQLKAVQTAIVREGMKYMDESPTEDLRLELLNTLRDVSEGKLHVELERARLTRQLAQVYEKDDRVKDAAEILQEVTVETIGSMERREKVDYIIDQMRLVSLREDWVRFSIISKKITPRMLQKMGDEAKKVSDEEAANSDELQLRYYDLMIRFHRREGHYFHVCQCYHTMYRTIDTVKNNTDKLVDAVQHFVLYLILSPYGEQQRDMFLQLASGQTDENVTLRRHMEGNEALKPYLDMVKAFVGSAVLQWGAFSNTYGAIVKAIIPDDEVTVLMDRVRTAVAQHDIRVLAKHYKRIYLQRMADVIGLPLHDAEKVLYEMVTAGSALRPLSGLADDNVMSTPKQETVVTSVDEYVYKPLPLACKTDRLKGIVTFHHADAAASSRSAQGDASEVLNSWANNVTDLLHKIGTVRHMIEKERTTVKA